jgi:hypothetical protein
MTTSQLPHQLALEIVTEVVTEVTRAGQSDLVSVARRLQRACGLLGWTPSGEWFRHELSGYPPEMVPQERYAFCRTRWITDNVGAMWVTMFDPPVKPGTGIWPLPSQIHELTDHLDSGYSWFATGRTQEIFVSTKNAVFTYREEVSVPKEAVAVVIQRIEQHCANFAIEAERQLRFGNLATNIFEQYRYSVDDGLARLEMGDSLDAIESNVQVGTPESAKLAVLGCRNVLLSLSAKLWQVPDLRMHPILKDRRGNPLQLGSEQPKARLRAYLFARGVRVEASGKTTLIAGQLDRIADTVDELYNLASDQGKNAATPEDARAAVLHLYLFLGELTRLTNLEPVMELPF